MTTGQLRVGAVLGVVLITLAALIWWRGDHPGGDAEVWQLEAESVQAFQVERRADRLSFEQLREGEWRLTEPETARADRWQVQELLDALEGLRWGTPIAETGHEIYGLQPPVARITTVLADGSERVLEVGELAPVGRQTYVRGADGGVVAVESTIGEVVSRDAERFRDLRLLWFNPLEIERIELVSPHGVLDLQRDDGDWELDGYGRAEPVAVDALLADLFGLHFEDLLGDVNEPMEAPRYQVVLHDEARGAHRLSVGEAGGEGTVVEVNGEVRGLVRTEALAFMDQGPRQLVPEE